MAYPKHVSPSDPHDTALAPYNFVPLPDQVVTLPIAAQDQELPDQDQYHPHRHIGHIDVTLVTKSPLYVRGPLTTDEFARQERDEKEGVPPEGQVKNKPDFFSADPSPATGQSPHSSAERQPSIPGSSLRGMLRTLVEIVSYSKVEAVTDEPLVYRAVGDTTTHGQRYREKIMAEGPRNWFTPRVRAGYMTRAASGDWSICPAQAIDGTTFARIHHDDIPSSLPSVPCCKNASRIYIAAGPYNFQDVKGGFLHIKYAPVLRAAAEWQPGLMKEAATLARSGPMLSKRREAVVYPKDPQARPIPIPERLVTAYRDQISPEQAALLGDDGVLQAGQPVFYLMDREDESKLIFFGHTMMLRLPYERTPLDFVPTGLRDRLTDYEKKADRSTTPPASSTDLAEALFGYTRDRGVGKARAYASRVFVENAVLAEGQRDIWLVDEKGLTPRILGSPKPTTFQHYLVQRWPNPEKVGETRDRRPVYRKTLSDYTAELNDTVLRGHKLYWRRGVVSADDIRESDQAKVRKAPKQYTRMRPVRAGLTFQSRIHFENLSDVELGALLWVLMLPGRPGQEYAHQLGMGKPFGMGVVQLTPALYLDDRTARYSSLFDNQGWATATAEANDRLLSFIGKFDGSIRTAVQATGEPTLASVPRIAALLKLLEWPGPPPDKTRYLEIEHPDPNARRGKINEYRGHRGRPVLPKPDDVAPGEPQRGPARVTGPAAQPAPQAPRTARPPVASPPPTAGPPAPAPRSATAPADGAGASPSPTPRPAVTPASGAGVPPRPTPTLSRPNSAEEIAPGMYLEGRVERVEGDRVVVALGFGVEATLARQKIVPPVLSPYDLAEQFTTGKTVRVWVEGRNQKGRWQVTMKRA